MSDELELRSLYVVFPDGSIQEMPVESVEFEFASEQQEPVFPCPSGAFEFTVDASIDRRALRLLLGIRSIGRRELLMHHRRRSPHGWRFRDR